MAAVVVRSTAYCTLVGSRAAPLFLRSRAAGRAAVARTGRAAHVAAAAGDAASLQEKIKSTNASSPVVVYSKTYCPCVRPPLLPAPCAGERARTQRCYAPLLSARAPRG